MRATLIKPIRNGKRAKNYVMRVYRQPGERPLYVPLHVSLRETAEKRKREYLLNQEKEEAGLLPSKSIRDASKLELSIHLDEYIQHMQQRGLSSAHIKGEENRLRRIIKECGWKSPSDIKRASLEIWLCTLNGCVAKTRNGYLDSARVFASWMVKRERLAANPLAGVEKAKVKGNEAKNRRAYSHEEIARLLEVSGSRSIVYRTAVYTGLRRGELEKLEWRDLDLEPDKLSIRVRASSAKNGKETVLPLHPDLAEKLREFKPSKSRAMDKVFKGLIGRKIEPLQRDLKKAGIPYVNEKGETADFHSFRHTFITWMALQGVPIGHAMHLARHSESRLTEKVYTDAGKLPLSKVVSLLPSVDADDSPYYSPKSGKVCPAASSAVHLNKSRKKPQSADNERVVSENPSLSAPVMEGEMVRGTGFEPVTPTMSR